MLCMFDDESQVLPLSVLSLKRCFNYHFCPPLLGTKAMDNPPQEPPPPPNAGDSAGPLAFCWGTVQ
jgi:hypothetical protein